MSELHNDQSSVTSVLRAAGAGFVILVLSAMLAKAYFRVVDHLAPAALKWRTSMDLDRIAAIRDAIPGIAAKDEPSAFLLGPSPAFYGFHPQAFDDAMREGGVTTVSYNFGTLGNMSETDRLLVLRLRDAFSTTGRRPKLILFVFLPSTASPAFAEGKTRPHVRKRALLSTFADLSQLFLSDPHLATELATLRFYGGTGAADANGLIGQRFLKNAGQGGPPIEWQLLAHKVSLGYVRQIGHFDLPTRGLFNPLEGNDLAEYERMADLAFSPGAVDLQHNHWGAPEFVNMVILPERIDWFVDAVAIAGELAEHVAIVVPPISDRMHLSAEGIRSTEAVIAEVQARTGVPLIDLRDRGFREGDFVDFTHLRYTTGAPKFSRMIAEALVPQMTSTAP